MGWAGTLPSKAAYYIPLHLYLHGHALPPIPPPSPHTRAPPQCKPAAVAARAAAVAAALGLGGCLDTMIGGVLPGGLLLRGLSGGERKRLSIGQGACVGPGVCGGSAWAVGGRAVLPVLRLAVLLGNRRDSCIRRMLACWFLEQVLCTGVACRLDVAPASVAAG